MAKRVFFSFHYDDVASFRANVVRNSGAFKKGAVQFYDGSIWEESKRKGTAALKTLIETGLKGTSVTAVLIGEETATRPWVRYEIMRSLDRGNALLGIRIHQIPDKNKNLGRPGPNPFDELGYKRGSQGTLELYEKKDGRWVIYAPLPSFKPSKNRVYKVHFFRDFLGRPTPLSFFVNTHTWQTGRDHVAVSDWIEEAVQSIQAAR